MDLPVSKESQRAFVLAMEEAENLNHRFIDPRRLGLGLLRLENCLAGDLLRQAGITPESLHVETEVVVSDTWSLAKVTASLETLIRSEHILNAGDEDFGSRRLKRISWSRKEGLGHLIDYAIVHHTLVARALTEPQVAANGYPDDSWASAQHYDRYHWLWWILG